MRVTVTLEDNACDVAEMSVLSATVTLTEKNEKKYTIFFIIDTYLTEDEAEKLVHSQTSAGIVKVKDSHAMPEPSALDREGMVLNREEAPLDVDIKNGGCVVVLNTKNLPLVGEVGLGADLAERPRHVLPGVLLRLGLPGDVRGQGERSRAGRRRRWQARAGDEGGGGLPVHCASVLCGVNKWINA
ncbi:unnamed protein product [Musa acuminata subsp. burmannicoides]